MSQNTMRSIVSCFLTVAVLSGCGSDANKGNPNGQAGGGGGTMGQAGAGGEGGQGGSIGSTDEADAAVSDDPSPGVTPDGGGNDATQDSAKDVGLADNGNFPKCTARPISGTTGRTPGGVLTNYPAFTFTKSGGDFDIISAYIKLTKLNAFNSVQVWGEVTNNTTTQQCSVLAGTFKVNSYNVLAVVDSPAYKGSIGLTRTCVEPGGKAYFKAIDNTVPATLLDGPTTVTYSMQGLPPSPASVRHPDEPRVVSAAAKQKFGWEVAGQLQGATMPIYDLQVSAYVRDRDGLIFEDLSAYPGDTKTIQPSMLVDFETLSTEDEFCGFEIIQDFIEGVSPSAAALVGGPGIGDGWTGAEREGARQRADFDAARRELQSAK